MKLPIKSILYLHGLASTPQSSKSRYLRKRFEHLGVTFQAPDLNLPAFEQLSFTDILATAKREIAEGLRPKALIASSFGAFVALHALGDSPSPGTPSHLVLLAPALRPMDSPRLGSSVLTFWKATGRLPMFHKGSQTERSIPYSFCEALLSLPTIPAPAIPTLIVHGKQDDTVPIEWSREYASGKPNVRLVELNSDHDLTERNEQLYELIFDFFRSTAQT